MRTYPNTENPSPSSDIPKSSGPGSPTTQLVFGPSGNAMLLVYIHPWPNPNVGWIRIGAEQIRQELQAKLGIKIAIVEL